jgi:hypothetical protein
MDQGLALRCVDYGERSGRGGGESHPDSCGDPHQERVDLAGEGCKDGHHHIRQSGHGQGGQSGNLGGLAVHVGGAIEDWRSGVFCSRSLPTGWWENADLVRLLQLCSMRQKRRIP